MHSYTDEQIKHIIERAARKLGSNPTDSEVRNIVASVIAEMERPTVVQPAAASEANAEPGSRVILTAFGQNHPGVIAGITAVLAKYDCDIQDMTQRLMQEFYTLMIIFDLAGTSFDMLRDELLKAGEDLGAKCLIQHEDIFRNMHRI
jgi:ACT domain-containing protein